MNDLEWRHKAVFEQRKNTASKKYITTWDQHLNNGEENEYRNSYNQLSFIANFTKGLPHTTETCLVHRDEYLAWYGSAPC